jgi:predicted nucleic acid-binding Zn ribbon protein
MNYPYKCPRCHIEFYVTLSVEVYEKIGENIKCPVCGGTQKARRQLVTAPVHFHGDGFTKSAKEE